jgi:hypothetical protein
MRPIACGEALAAGTRLALFSEELLSPQVLPGFREPRLAFRKRHLASQSKSEFCDPRL